MGEAIVMLVTIMAWHMLDIWQSSKEPIHCLSSTQSSPVNVENMLFHTPLHVVENSALQLHAQFLLPLPGSNPPSPFLPPALMAV